MRFAIIETIVGAGGHEIEHDRQIINGLRQTGHVVELFVPEGAELKDSYGLQVKRLKGSGISYAGAKGWRKLLLSCKRELNRLKWYKQVYALSRSGNYDAILFPMVTYRFLRSLNKSVLRRAVIPVLFGVIGVAEHELKSFAGEAKKLERYGNIRLVNFSVTGQKSGMNCPNLFSARMSLYIAATKSQHKVVAGSSLHLGFIGQYRREKDMAGFLQVFSECSFNKKVKLTVQMAALNPKEKQELLEVENRFSGLDNVVFTWGKYYGEEWNAFVDGFDALVVPYANDRYKQNGSGVLLTALGAKKPVVIADSVWPELLSEYKFGVVYKTGDKQQLKIALEQLVNNWEKKIDGYCKEIARVTIDYSPENIANDIVRIARI
ncbi:MAG: glycosyltransferase [Negativicutes bacterium]|jgi:glycosyltransferase involved in cell wall biosynthesis